MMDARLAVDIGALRALRVLSLPHVRTVSNLTTPLWASLTDLRVVSFYGGQLTPGVVGLLDTVMGLE